MYFDRKSYYQEKFTKVSLSVGIITETEFEECEFIDCRFVDCTFEKCTFLNCQFSNSMLSAIHLKHSSFVDVVFTDSKVIGIDWTKLDRVSEINFDSCQLNYSSFRMLKLPKMKMVCCEAKEVDFTDADLSGSDFHETDFLRSVFSKTNVTKALFTGARNYRIDARNNTIRKAHFSLPEALSLLESLDVVID